MQIFFFPVDLVLPVIVRKHRVKVLVLVIELMKRLVLGRANFFSQVWGELTISYVDREPRARRGGGGWRNPHSVVPFHWGRGENMLERVGTLGELWRNLWWKEKKKPSSIARKLLSMFYVHVISKNLKYLNTQYMLGCSRHCGLSQTPV